MTKYLLHQDQNNQSWLRKTSLTQHWLNIYHKLNYIFRLVLCWFEGSQSGNNDNVILYMARHHPPTDFLVFRHWQIQPRVRILNLPREENTCRVQTLAQRLLTDPLQGSSSKLKKVSAKVLISTGHQTDPTPTLFLLCNNTNLDMACFLYSIPKHLPLATADKISGR